MKKPTVFYLLYITIAFAVLILLITAAGDHSLNIYPQNAFADGYELDFPGDVAATVEKPAEVAGSPGENGNEAAPDTSAGREPWRIRAGAARESFSVTVRDPGLREPQEIHQIRVGRFGMVYDEMTGNFSNCRLISALITLYVLTCAAGLFIGWRRQIAYSVYSYNTVMYMGFGIFTLMAGITLTFGVIRTIREPAEATMHTVYMLVLNSAMNFLVFTAPFLVVFAGAMIVSNIALVRHEGRRIKNILGILVSEVFLIADLLIIRYGYRYLHRTAAHMDQTGITGNILLTNLAAAVYLYAECMLIGAMIASLIPVKKRPAYDKDYMIILGCAIRKDGRPTPLLKGRCDRAIAFRNAQKKAAGRDLIFVTSGGKGSDEVISESRCMRDYLVSQGIPESQILMEDRSASTMENMQFSRALIHADAETPVVFSTTQYHVFRSGILARRSGMKAAEGCGAPTKWYFWPNAWVREFLGFMSSHKLKQFLVLAGTIAVYVLLSLLLGGKL
ncbi:MAG: YdcF family protein [Eubacterium sp.]|nr:YdcF family protein [Eubacterium sp.]